tara:strand:- start:306 stop:1052 length:747 start_codon:yes stop_codon:yes gene_type:complete
MIKYLYENERIFSEYLEKLDNWKTGNIRSVLDGSNQVFLLELFCPNFNDSLLCVYKPMIGEKPLFDFPSESLYKREMSSFVISRILGWPNIPSTTIRNGPLGIGTLQKFIDHDSNKNYFTLRDSCLKNFECFALFDLLVNNSDRKASSCIKDSKNKIWSLDHGLTFNENSRLRTVMFEFSGMKISDQLKNDLMKLKDNLNNEIKLRDLLVNWLSQNSFDFFIERLDFLIELDRYPYLDVNLNVPWPLL